MYVCPFTIERWVVCLRQFIPHFLSLYRPFLYLYLAVCLQIAKDINADKDLLIYSHRRHTDREKETDTQRKTGKRYINRLMFKTFK